MSSLSPPVNRLITELSRLPGVGQRTAQRLAFHILRLPPEEALPLAEAIREVKEKVGQCEVCFNLAVGPRCRICEDERRDPSLICVVEEPSDILPIERTNEFNGRYHVLGGALSPIDGVDPEDIRIPELLERVAAGGVREVVVATNSTTTGEATALYIAEQMRERSPNVAVTRLASGLPVGADLEYADEITLGRALRARREL
ncbi:MAG: recombination protein RecR [Thermoleophilaceae bacterium]|nr:recombination protein RecR [Thermoleophilaceae bacterium]